MRLLVMPPQFACYFHLYFLLSADNLWGQVDDLLDLIPISPLKIKTKQNLSFRSSTNFFFNYFSPLSVIPPPGGRGHLGIFCVGMFRLGLQIGTPF